MQARDESTVLWLADALHAIRLSGAAGRERRRLEYEVLEVSRCPARTCCVGSEAGDPSVLALFEDVLFDAVCSY